MWYTVVVRTTGQKFHWLVQVHNIEFKVHTIPGLALSCNCNNHNNTWPMFRERQSSIVLKGNLKSSQSKVPCTNYHMIIPPF